MDIDDPKLTAYVLGELSPTEAAAVEAALARDPRQRQAVAELRECSAWLSEGLREEPCPRLTAAQRQAVFRPERRRPAEEIAFPWLGWWRYGAAAIAGAAACGLALWWLQTSPHSAASLANNPTAVPASGTRGDSAEHAQGQLAPDAATVTPRSTFAGTGSAGRGDARNRNSNRSAAGTTARAAASVNPAENVRQGGTAAPPLELEAAAVQNLVAGRSRAVESKLVPLALNLPVPVFLGTPTDLAADAHLESPHTAPRPAFLAPEGVRNVALNKPVRSSDLQPLQGELSLITDGNKEVADTNYVELHRKVQWVQIDLETAYRVYALVVWHSHHTPQVYNSVVVQVADDAEFSRNVRMLFNNDFENAAGLGAGTDLRYYESYEGKLIDARGESARYVRLYSAGSNASALNRYLEVEVYGLPAGQ